MKHYCPNCHSTQGFNVINEIRTTAIHEGQIICNKCKHKFRVEVKLRFCDGCKSQTVCAIHRTVKKKEIFAFTCLRCGFFEEGGD